MKEPYGKIAVRLFNQSAPEAQGWPSTQGIGLPVNRQGGRVECNELPF